jgi:hypothetical protein
MLELSKIDLGKDEAEQDERLKEYFLKTTSYENALTGNKTIIVGRKGSGKSAIFTLVQEELKKSGMIVIPITPNEYHWKLLKEYEEQGISLIQSHINVWKTTLLFSVISTLHDLGKIPLQSDIRKYYEYTKNSEYNISPENWFISIVDSAKQFISSIKSPFGSIDFKPSSPKPVPISLIQQLTKCLLSEWATYNYNDWEKQVANPPKVRIVIDRLDDNWDASENSKNLIIGLLKAANDLNRLFNHKILITIFLRADIYDCLFFDDQDKLRQYEEILIWDDDALKNIVCERVKVSLNLPNNKNNHDIWSELFSDQLYRSKATAEKYIIDRTFKRPRDIISFVRFAIEYAIENNSQRIEPVNTRTAEEKKYSQSKYKDLIIEYQKQVPYVRDLLDSFSSSLHKQSKQEIEEHIQNFINRKELRVDTNNIIQQLFVWGVIGVKRQGGASVNRRGGTHFCYYYDDPSIQPLRFDDYYIHPSLRHYLSISERRERNDK